MESISSLWNYAFRYQHCIRWSGNRTELIPLMNALTGMAVCLMIFILGILMVHKSKRTKTGGLS